MPELVSGSNPTHYFRCHIPVGTEENRVAYEKNLAERLPQTVAFAEGVVAKETVG